jgi:carboxymethylenebutenolidase
MKIQSLRIAAAVVVLLGCAWAQTPDWARQQWEHSPREKAWLQVPHGTRTVDTFVVFPEGTAKAPVVLLIHDVQGMNDFVQNVADQFAAHGYIAMAPDLLSGMGPEGGGSNSFTDHRWAQQANEKLPTAQVMADLNAVADVAKTMSGSNGKLAVVGLGWGGTQSFTFASQRSDLDAAFVFHATAPADAGILSKIKTPIYDFYGSNDERVSSTISQTKEMMQGKTFDPVSYEGANPDFLLTAEAPYPSWFDGEARRQAWQRMLSVLKGM